MKRLFILHVLPLEYYPPVTNLLRLLNKEELNVQVYSTYNNKDRKEFKLQKSKIFRSVYPAYSKNLLQRLFSFFILIFGPLYRLVVFRPDSIIYFEPHSSYPVYLYTKYFNKKAKLFIHYHEYYSPKDFEGSGMRVIKYFHGKEKNFLYSRASWISQTNKNRIAYFLKDNPSLSPLKLQTLANYPPKKWLVKKEEPSSKTKINFLYIGALSFENTYIEEFIDFIRQNPNETELGIYSYNLHEDVKSYLMALNATNIKFVDGGVAYADIPERAKQYNVGLVLYKGHNINYQYNAPNKLFEYLATGLNVWVPNELLGCATYLNETSRPFVASVNYKQLDNSLLSSYLKQKDLPYKPVAFNCEDELAPLLKKIKED